MPRRKGYKSGIDPAADEAERFPLFADQIRGAERTGVESSGEEIKPEPPGNSGINTETGEGPADSDADPPATHKLQTSETSIAPEAAEDKSTTEGKGEEPRAAGQPDPIRQMSVEQPAAPIEDFSDSKVLNWEETGLLTVYHG